MLGILISADVGRRSPPASAPLLRAVVHRLQDQGVQVAGALDRHTPQDRGGRAHMDLDVLGHPTPIRISQALGPGAKGCRLDAAGLEQAVGLVSAQLETAAVQAVVVNKFGKQEAEGRGFRTVIAQAIGAALPVVVCVSPAYRAAFDAFAEGSATPLPWARDEIAAWVLQHLR